MVDIAVLFSGRGSNLNALIERSQLADSAYNVAVALTDNPNAGGIQIAHGKGVTTVVIPDPYWEWRATRILSNLNVKFVVLAGFMKILGVPFCSAWAGKCINIHPSLLPKYKGLDTHRRALENSDSVAGCTVHFVTPDLDSGPIIAQREVVIDEDDTPSSLAAKVLKEENLLLPAVVQALTAGQIGFDGDKVVYRSLIRTLNQPLTLEDLV